jgi:hypothetical protein
MLFFEGFVFITYVKSQRHQVKQLLARQLTVLSQIEKQCFFITQMTVPRYVVVSQFGFNLSKWFTRLHFGIFLHF